MPQFNERRRKFIGKGIGMVAALALSGIIDFQVKASEMPFFITTHGFNGSSDSGLMGELNYFLAEQQIPFEALNLPGGMTPNREQWDDLILRAVRRAPKPPTLVGYSLSVPSAINAASNESIERLVTWSGRRLMPELPSNFSLAYFYDKEINLTKLSENTPDGRLVVHSRDDGRVKFEENADQLGDQLGADKYFVNGFGHFENPSHALFIPCAHRVIFG